MLTGQAISTTVSITVLKPVEAVFKAVLIPTPFFVEKASGPLAEGKTITWKFPEMPNEIPVIVKKIVPQESIRFEWGSSQGGNNTCEFKFSKPEDENPAIKYDGPATTVTVTESGWPDNEQGRKASYGNTMGWTHMISCLKAWLEYNVNLRKGAFLHNKF